MRDYEEGLQVLKEIKSKWDEGKKLTVMDWVYSTARANFHF